MKKNERAAYRDFEVDVWTHVFGGLVSRYPRFWIGLGNLETRMLAESLRQMHLRSPIYVSGLARAGTTILLESLARHPDVATHRYRDYPGLFTPVWWNEYLDRIPGRKSETVERSHRDGIWVTPESPEAFEEMLWMAFFPSTHDSAVSQVLDAETGNQAFEAFYRDHIRKLLLLRGGSRYLAKGNYNLTRCEYLLKLFPDARFVIAVREPATHIASLMKQHRLFSAAEKRNPRALAYMRRAGHFEFGLDRRAINAGDAAAVAEVERCWREGREVEGWARYWAHLYGRLADRLEASSALREAVFIVRYEDLCRVPGKILSTLFDHCALPAAEEWIARMGETLHAPSYYRPTLGREERALIRHYTAVTTRRLGYEGPAVPVS